jgi:hypothetical protein
MAAVMVRKQKEIVAAFRQAGAMTPTTAVTIGSIGVHDNLPFRKLRGHSVLREAGDGRFYLDDERWSAVREIRRRYAIAAILAGVSAVLIVLGIQMSLR